MKTTPGLCNVPDCTQRAFRSNVIVLAKRVSGAVSPDTRLGLAFVDSVRVARKAEEVGLQLQRCQRRSFVTTVRSIRAKLALVVAGGCLTTGVEEPWPTFTAPWRALFASRSEAKFSFAIQTRRGCVVFRETARRASQTLVGLSPWSVAPWTTVLALKVVHRVLAGPAWSAILSVFRGKRAVVADIAKCLAGCTLETTSFATWACGGLFSGMGS